MTLVRSAEPAADLLRYARHSGSSSFTDFLADAAPDLLPANRPRRIDVVNDDFAPHGTTIVALTYQGGVLMAGDRRATMGNLIAQRDIEKVFAADDYCMVGIAGTAGIAIEIVRLFQVELEHYEKIEGTPLTLEGKANRLATMIRGNLAAAMQGLAVVPLFAGFDVDAVAPAAHGAQSARGHATSGTDEGSVGAGQIYSFDVTGGRYAEQYYYSVGSGSVFARSSMKKRWSAELDSAGAVRVAVEALYDAADDDSATGGPDLARGIFPVVMIADVDGVRRIPDPELDAVVREIVAERTGVPGS